MGKKRATADSLAITHTHTFKGNVDMVFTDPATITGYEQQGAVFLESTAQDASPAEVGVWLPKNDQA